MRHPAAYWGKAARCRFYNCFSPCRAQLDRNFFYQLKEVIMSRRGRRPVLDERKKAEILAVLSTGCDWETAAIYVHCHPKTIHNTAHRDPAFAEKLGRMRKKATISHLANINVAGKEPHYWRASAWFLEHLDPDNYGLRSPETVKPDQIKSLMEELFKIMIEEVPVARFRKAIIKRLEKLYCKNKMDDKELLEIGKNLDEERQDFPENTKMLTEETPKNEKIDV
jgi:hypothetical protein